VYFESHLCRVPTLRDGCCCRSTPNGPKQIIVDGQVVEASQSQRNETGSHAILILRPRAILALQPHVDAGRIPSQAETQVQTQASA
jgi:hypothetical protein